MSANGVYEFHVVVELNMETASLKFRFAAVISLLSVIGYSAPAHGQSHEYIMMMRYAVQHHIFVSQSVEGSYGLFKKSSSEPSSSTAAITSTSGERSMWQGYDLRTAVGIELMKFLNFSLAHDSVNLRSKIDGQESMSGSKLSGEGKLEFVSPMGNLEFGGAITGSRYDYQKGLESGGYFGSGFYYLIGWNYFMTYNVSAFATAKINQEHMVPNGGSSSLSTMDSDLTSLGAGFSLWL